ncbi:FAD assembly factor SdhE [Labrys wisconsinensis]|uniref:FAD assembly factor SdhE n=1 Tax=Labrys wisconsinensis TaxID=425677 RepID=A0ABU0J3H5_9HYPH|nr:succinate dehydrogenase assembly factor 2 [Labrys wisconsinensis]MDQ0468819.1 antitoxin CptB [Labrys wisconsinensis]
MSGTTRSSSDLDPRRRRLLFRAWHRGTREMDLLMGPFCDAEIGTLGEEDVAAFERLIEAEDHDLYDWITGTAATPDIHDTGLMHKLRAFHARPGRARA